MNYRNTLCPLAILSATGAIAYAAASAIEITAEKQTIRADGRSTTFISVRVLNERGTPVDDGTRVRITTTNGRLDTELAETRNGLARVTLTASDQSGSATVTATLDGASAVPARVVVQFSNDTDASDSSDRWLRIHGTAYTVYSTQIPNSPARIVDAVGKKHDAVVTFRDIEIRADHIQLRLGGSEVFAEGEVELRIGGVKRNYYRLRYDLQQRTGIGESSAQIIGLRDGANEVPLSELPNAAPPQWQFLDLSGASVTISSAAIAVDPNGTLQFRRATFYLDGQKAFSTPFHIMNSGQRTLFRDQLLGYGPAGPTLNLPLYYDVRPSGVGTFHLRRGAQFGSSVYSYRSGWSIDLDQTYNGRGGVTGLFQAQNLARPERGFRLQHAQKLSPQTDANVFIDLPGSKTLFASTQLGHAFSRFRLGLSTSGSRYSGQTLDGQTIKTTTYGDLRNQLLAETYLKRLRPRSHVQYTMTGSAAIQSYYGTGNGGVRTENLGSRLIHDPVALGKQFSLTQSAVVGYTWVHAGTNSTAGQTGVSMQGTTGLRRPIKGTHGESLGNALISYDYSRTPPLFTPTGPNAVAVPFAQHRLGFNAYMERANVWNVSVSGSRGLNTLQNSFYSELRTAIGGSYWARLRLTTTQTTGFSYRDSEYALVRSIQGREISLYYSTTTKRFLVDLTALGI